MKNKFEEFYIPKPEDIKHIWANAIVVLDANVLLSLYRYSSSTRNKLIALMNKYKDKLWLPHQVGLEFYRSRLKVIDDSEKAYDNVDALIKKSIEDLSMKIKEKYARHPYIDADKLSKGILKCIHSVKSEISKKKEKHPNRHGDDEILEKIEKIFKGTARIGEHFSDAELDKIYQDGERRYSQEIPPGYKDIDKDKEDKTKKRKFGDLIIWNQLIVKALESKKSIIFVTDEQKEDWWLKVNGKIMGPRYELIKEMKDKAKARFYMYQTERLLAIERTIDASVVKEIQQISDSDKIIEDLLSVTKDIPAEIQVGGFDGLTQNIGINVSQTIESGDKLNFSSSEDTTNLE